MVSLLEESNNIRTIVTTVVTRNITALSLKAEYHNIFSFYPTVTRLKIPVCPFSLHISLLAITSNALLR